MATLQRITLIFFLSLRNLLRQKRRNILLGAAIGFSVMVLVTVTSFTSGLVDLFMNKIMVYAFGHVYVALSEKGNLDRTVIRDKERILSVISNEAKGIDFIGEDLFIAGRGVGNGKSGMFMVVGVPLDHAFLSTFAKTKDGTLADMTNGKLENPVLIGEQQAKGLNVKVHDIINVRFQTIYGQEQTAKLTVGAIVSAANPMMTFASFIDAQTVRSMLGYSSNEAGGYKVVFKKVDAIKNVIDTANRIHARLTPGNMAYHGSISANGRTAPVTVFGVLTNEKAHEELRNTLVLRAGSYASLSDKKRKDGIMLSAETAERIGAGVGSSVRTVYKRRFGGTVENTYTVFAVYDGKFSGATALAPDFVMDEKKFYELLPEYVSGIPAAYTPGSNVLPHALAPEWKRLDRTSTTEELFEKTRLLKREKPRTQVLDIQTLYESLEIVTQIGSVINYIAIAVFIVLLSIVIIGVFNTLRMTIRERTREIGTVRAIGMQQGDVLNIFIFESGILSFFASIVGVVMAFVLMGLLSLITIETDSMFSMFLYERHLYFLPIFFKPAGALLMLLVLVLLMVYVIIVPKLKIRGFVQIAPLIVLVLCAFAVIAFSYSIVTIFFLMVAATIVTTYLPARKAANMAATDALRHYE